MPASDAPAARSRHGCRLRRSPAAWRQRTVRRPKAVGSPRHSLPGSPDMTDRTAPATYRFGDSEVAIDRLAIVAELFAPTTEAFVQRWWRDGTADQGSPASVIDLGCGPGFTTELLAAVCRPWALVGLDGSAAMVTAARARVPGASFAAHDVTAVPLPGAPADLVFARYLLAHLPDPAAAV